MFANMTYEDKVAFFELLDEYFDSRPNLFNNATSPISPQATSSSSRTLPPASTSSGGRTLPPMASSTRSPPPLLNNPPSPTNSTNNSNNNMGFSFGAAPGQKPDLATRMVLGSFKMGASGASKGLGYLSKNQQAMDALGRVGANAMVNHAKSGLDRSTGQGQQQGGEVNGQTSPTQVMSPPPQRTPSGPPPSRAPPARKAPEPTPAADAQAQALYDYEAGDSNDLGVQAGQVVYIVQKTSDDWWTCEDANGQKGLIPSAYLKQL